MPFTARAFFTSAMLAMASAQGVIMEAKGDSGKSVGLQVDTSDTSDANFISSAEIEANVVNECGRTIKNGNIDIGEKTETALANGGVTKVTQGGTVKLKVNQVNSNGTGPYTCDLDETSNASGTSGQVALDVTQGDSGDGTGEMTMSVTLPSDMACTGSSKGNVCTIRCRNSNDYGGCVAVQQTDTAGLPANNSPSNITTAQTLDGIMAQVQENQKDLPAAVAGNQAATNVDDQGVDIAQSIIDSNSAIEQSVEQELATAAVSSSTASATSASKLKRMSPAGRRASRYVISGKSFENEGSEGN